MPQCQPRPIVYASHDVQLLFAQQGSYLFDVNQIPAVYAFRYITVNFTGKPVDLNKTIDVFTPFDKVDSNYPVYFFFTIEEEQKRCHSKEKKLQISPWTEAMD